ncbi:Receptor-like protein kinase FERONIA [Morus notabilis]|uniref:Receptor-like protein kinase FERONIA n=1 Tax=Morus notabilis TaxID=981085 RepID=W9RYH5_9ROSA|nr:Receptor-like protein kinase FERONIA [Morus notabilis]
MGPTTISKAHVSTIVKGSIEYLDPEYYRRQQLETVDERHRVGPGICYATTAKCDVIGGAIMEAKGEEEVAFMINNNSDGTFTCSWEESLELRSSRMTKISSSEQGSTTDESMKGMSGAVFFEMRSRIQREDEQIVQPLPYPVEENITIDCGSEGKTTSHAMRSWDGDRQGSKFLHLSEGHENASISVRAVERPDDPVPYETARLSRSEIRYTIPLIPGPKFIRLYFFASTYENNYNRSKALFSVKAGRYTLLRNFSTSLTAGDLYYSESNVNSGIDFVGQTGSYRLSNTALETLYRVNVGGKDLSPAEDTGFFRKWDGMSTADLSYMINPGESALLTNSSINIAEYIAPAAVYTTARSMGPSDIKHNLTWEFPVDSEFSYMVRLHFCEIQLEINKTGDQVFSILIAEQTADAQADVIKWSGAKYTPCFRDFVVKMIRKPGQKNLTLRLDLQAIFDHSISTYPSAILNGIEIFKLSDNNANLAGPNPDPILQSPSASQQQMEPEKNRTSIIAIICGTVISGVILLVVLGFFILRRARKVKDSTSNDGTTWWGPLSFTTIKSSKTRGSSSLPSDLCRYFSLAEIKAATNNFEDIFIIGVGGFGNVYKGYIDNGTNPVAIKRLKSESSQGAHEFKTEIEMLSHLRHRHLVSLIGYCNEDREMILVYDYMARGTLRCHLYNTENPPLTWKQRLEICIGAARGLHYLHTGAKYTIIHRDVKTTNILLDEKWVAKVSDFGLSKMGPTTMSKAHVSTVVKGSIGYLDPEYYRRQQLSEKSDVYSFGVVLCEVLCGRPPIMRNAEKRQVSLAEWAQHCYRNGTLHQIIDRNLTSKIVPECLKKYSEIAVNCMHDNGIERPSMNDVVWGLEFAMQLQQNAEDNDRIGGAIMEAKGEDEVAFMNNNNSDGTFTYTWEESLELKSSVMTKISSSEQGSITVESMKEMSGAVFSEIKDPKGR